MQLAIERQSLHMLSELHLGGAAGFRIFRPELLIVVLAKDHNAHTERFVLKAHAAAATIAAA